MSYLSILLVILSTFNFLHGAFAEKPMVFVVPSYNNIKYYKKNLDSLFSQNYKNYRVIYIDDCSSDGTADAVESYVEEINQNSRFTLIRNEIRRGALENLYWAIYSCNDNEIIATVDGDDWLYHPNVLNQLNSVYSTKEVWLTHGKIIEYPHNGTGWSIPIPQENIINNTFRQYRCPSHLRTFYAWLFKNIKTSDLLDNGHFFQMTWDMAMMYPMIEMAGERHAFINEISYVYNMSNPINDNKVNPDLQNQYDRMIRNMPRYQRLESAPGQKFNWKRPLRFLTK